MTAVAPSTPPGALPVVGAAQEIGGCAAALPAIAYPSSAHYGLEYPAEKWAAGLDVPAYAVDDQTAFKVIDGTVEVISEGYWKLLKP